MAKTISIDEIGSTIEKVVGALKKHEARIKQAPLQWLLGEMLTRIHTRGENSDGDTMNYKSVRHMNNRMARGLRTDVKDLQFTENSLLFGLQLVKGRLEFVGNRNADGRSIAVNQLAEWQENIEKSDIWRPSDKELKEFPKRFILELTKVLKENI